MKAYIKNQAQKVLEHPSVAPLSNLFTPVFSGIGSIVMFHRVVPDADHIVCGDLEITVDHLEVILEYFVNHGYEIVSLDRAYDIISGKQKTSRKFVVFTFDDGYEDNYSIAYPIFKKYNLPFTIYVTTSFPDKAAIIWWYALKEFIKDNKAIDFIFEGKNYNYQVETENQKEQVYVELRQLILSLANEQQTILFNSMFDENGIDIKRFSNDLTMDWNQVKELSKDSLVTIGAHTISHSNLKNLEEETAKKEIIDSKNKIEAFTGVKVEHFAFPFGSVDEAGEREFELAGQLGFKTSTTTRCGNIFPEHAGHMNCLPRITPSPYILSSFPQFYASGFIPALKQNFKRVITH